MSHRTKIASLSLLSEEENRRSKLFREAKSILEIYRKLCREATMDFHSSLDHIPMTLMMTITRLSTPSVVSLPQAHLLIASFFADTHLTMCSYLRLL